MTALRAEDMQAGRQAALDSERQINPGTRELTADELPLRGKMLLARDSGAPFASGQLRLRPLRDDGDWAAYLQHRIAVEAELGASTRQTSLMVASMRQRACSIKASFHLAREGSRTVGAIGWFRLVGRHDVARLQEVDVFPEFRGLGHGNRLLEAARSTLRASGVQMLIVGADEDDWPLEWYRRKGFRPVVRVPGSGAG